MEVANPGANGGPLSPPAPLPGNGPIDANAVVEHLADLLGVTLGAAPEDLEAPGSLLAPGRRAETVARCQRFAADTQTVLYVLKDIVKEEQQHANGVNGAAGELGAQWPGGGWGMLTWARRCSGAAGPICLLAGGGAGVLDEHGGVGRAAEAPATY